MPIPNPVAFNIFGLDIMWYAILICIGIVICTILTCKRAPLHGFTSDQILNLVLISVPVGIIGARLYYVLFNWRWYYQDMLQIFNTRAGGLAIHGGLLAGLGTAALICYLKEMSPLSLLDLIAPSIALGQAIGRWGNYFNSEAHGGPTDLPWAVIVDGQAVHPTFLYESIWCFLLFLFLLWYDGRQRHPFKGQIFLLYGILYSVERFFVEALRTDSLMLGPFKQAQILSLVTLLVMLIAYLILAKRQRNQ